LTIAQRKASHRRIRHRYKAARGRSVSEAIAREKAQAAREANRKKKG
jgi:hypothetical protein